MSFARLRSKARQILTSRGFLGLFISLLVISMSVTYVASEPRSQERFLSISTLGSGMMAEDYYPNGSSAIGIRENVKWYLSVKNHMGDVEYVSLRIKLLNSTQALLDNNSNTRNPSNPLIEMKQMLMNNSTWIVPLSWTITDVDNKPSYTVIKSLVMNGIQLDNVDVRSSDGNFRMVIEVWRYDTETGDFSFVWSSGLDKRSAWNHIWFSVKQNT